MPLVVDGAIRVALINNMPDSVLEDTESQFIDLLGAASGDIPVSISLFSLPGVSRGQRAQTRIDTVYCGFERLWNSRFDALIVTGTEPRHRDLRQEPYWPSLVDVLHWAEENTASTVLSCLAAHAGVLSSDGIVRQRLPDKQFGVFSFQKRNDHRLTGSAAGVFRFPHSRWNELPSRALASCGYTILTESADAGVDVFIKQKRKSLFVHFQGHPEYRNETLFKEYRRDIKRFLKGSRDTYPSQPFGYFDSEAGEALSAFRAHAMSHRSEQVMADFPEDAASRNLANTWRSTAVDIYRNWLFCIASNRREARARSAVRRTQEIGVTL